MPETALTEQDRRAIGNLSIPRNAQDLAHVLRSDPHALALEAGEWVNWVPSDADSDKHLRALEKAGWVTNLGSHDDPAKLAASLERKRGALAMPDEKANLYVERVLAPVRRWRTRGDLWLLTEEGLDKLHEPAGPARRLSTAELEAVIRSEFSRIATEARMEGSIFDVGGEVEGGRLLTDVPLSDRLLPEEFSAWLEAVVEDHERATGERPQIPIAGGSYSDSRENLIQDADVGKSSYTETAPTFQALTTVAVTDADTGSTITEAGYTGYARKSCAAADFGASAAGSRSNTTAEVFAACTAGTSTIIGTARCTAATVGQVIRRASVASTVVSTTQTPPQFAVGALGPDTLD